MTAPANDNVLTTKAIADKLGTDPRTLRVFLRASSDYEAVGSGARYEFKNKDVATMKTRFVKWSKEREAARVAKTDAKAAAVADDDVTTDEDVAEAS